MTDKPLLLTHNKVDFERKFLLTPNFIANKKIKSLPTEHVVEYFLKVEEEYQEKIIVKTINGNTEYIFIRHVKPRVIRNSVEEKITFEEFLYLMNNCIYKDQSAIYKTKYIISENCKLITFDLQKPIEYHGEITTQIKYLKYKFSDINKAMNFNSPEDKFLSYYIEDISANKKFSTLEIWCNQNSVKPIKSKIHIIKNFIQKV